MPRSFLLAALAAAMLAIPAAAGPRAEFPQHWFGRSDDAAVQRHLRQIEGRQAPEIDVGAWLEFGDDKGQFLKEMRGKIVLIDFWATWCGPCKRALPMIDAIAQDYRDRGVEVIGVVDDKGGERLAEVAREHNVRFPVAVERNNTSGRFGLKWWPFLILIDREGVIRAAGISPRYAAAAIDALLKEQPPTAPAAPGGSAEPPADPAGQIPRAWLEGSNTQRKVFAAMEGKAPPSLEVQAESWTTGSPVRLEDLAGKVVLVNFWTAWDPNAQRDLSKIQRLAEEHRAAGLEVIGVVHHVLAERAPGVLGEAGVTFPNAVDDAGKTYKAYRVDSPPDYFLIDRAGKLRAADVKDDDVARAVEVLLAEPAPEPAQASGAVPTPAK